MAKVKTAYFCQNCGARSAAWMGKCSSCHEWNTYVEEVIESPTSLSKSAGSSKYHFTPQADEPTLVKDIAEDTEARIPVADKELSRVLGGGLVRGSAVLIGGEPGIGKSTLMLQLALGFSGGKSLYISGEESKSQLKMRAGRLGGGDGNECYILIENNTKAIAEKIKKLSPGLIIVDSIQTLVTDRIESSAGSVSQIKECTAELIHIAKQTGIPLVIIGHITKDGAIAGPKVLEHMVDTVLQFEGDRNYIYRILRSQKNRFGSTSEIGIYEMKGAGLMEVSDPSTILLSNRNEMLSGVAINATLEGMRPLLIESQALVSSAVYGTPQRSATGFDLRRLNMLLAVLEKRCGFRLGAKDVFLNIAGGIRVEDPAIDLGVLCAILSSAEDVPIPPKTCFAGEVGLSGEIRPVNRIDQRINECLKLGFERIIVSKFNKISNLKALSQKIHIEQYARVDEVFRAVFEKV